MIMEILEVGGILLEYFYFCFLIVSAKAKGIIFNSLICLGETTV
jgi:hypothetical protein